jgi:hypothetical protein
MNNLNDFEIEKIMFEENLKLAEKEPDNLVVSMMLGKLKIIKRIKRLSL